MARKNATFTLDKTYGSGSGDRSFIEAFYYRLNDRYPGNTPVPIPPLSQVHPHHDGLTQSYIFADFAVRKIAPIALRKAELNKEAAKLANLPEITSIKSARAAAAAADAAAAAANKAYFTTRRRVGRESAAHHAAYAYHVARFAVAARAAAADAAHSAARTADNIGYTEAITADAARAVYCAAYIDHNATWDAVNEMLQAL